MTVPAAPDLFASDDQLAALEAGHAQAPQAPAAAMALAWALRQRDPTRSLALARAAARDEAALRPRLWLIESERATANRQPEEAEALRERAQAAFAAAGDAAGGVDALLLLCTATRLRSNDPAVLAPQFDALLSAADAAGEPGRQMYCRAFAARGFVWLFAGAAEARCAALRPAPDAVLTPAAQAVWDAYWTGALAFRSDAQASMQRRQQHGAAALALALQTGQGQLACRIASGLAAMQNEGGEPAAALLSSTTAAALARRIWPTELPECLWTHGRLLQALGQLAEAREVLEECLRLESANPDSRVAAHARVELGRVAFEQGDAEAAVALLAQAIRSPLVRASARAAFLLDYTRCLLNLKRTDEAEAALQEASALGEGQMTGTQTALRRALAVELRLARGEVAQARQAGAALIADMDAQPGLTPWPFMLELVARAHAADGRLDAAYALGQRALEAERRLRSHQTVQRSQAFALQFRGEQARAQAERLAALERSHRVLDQLGTIGRELTAQLDAGRALAVLAAHLRTLLAGDCLLVYLLDEAGSTLHCALCEDQGRAVPAAPLALDDAVSLIARCARERQVLVPEDDSAQEPGLDGAAPKRSRLYAPLTLGERLVGVMSVQSTAAESFDAEARLVFATLCAYAAIALDNARAYRQLDQMQRRLRARERMASMGVLVAGISHELNTPLGNAVLAVSTLRQGGAQLAQMLTEGTLRRNQLQGFLADTGMAVDLIDGSLQRLSLLSGHFKQVAQDSSQLKRERVLLREVIRLALHKTQLALENAAHRPEIEADPALALDTFAGPLADALAIALANAAQHGLAGRGGGGIRLRATQQDGSTVLHIEDDGAGMSEDVLRRAFEPFFTTRMGPHTGLGLTILHNIVADMLGGEARLASVPGRGTTLTLVLPPLPPE